MRTQQQHWTIDSGWTPRSGEPPLADAQLVLAFGGGDTLLDPELLSHLRRSYPMAAIVGCSTAGEICGDWVYDDSLVATALAFERTTVRAASIEIPTPRDSEAMGRALARRLADPSLAHVLLLAEGMHVDQAALVYGMNETLGPGIGITGGFAGDSVHFRRTLVLGDGVVGERRAVAVGLYGSAVLVGYGTLGGWDPFGPARLVTRSAGNVAYEMDGEPALDIYARYLGEDAPALPASALRFPFSMRVPGRPGEVVRTVCAVDWNEKSLTFPGDVPEGATLRMLRANVERLIDAASTAATVSTARLPGTRAEFAMLVSCVGRKLLMGQHVDEEVECVRAILGRDAVCAGFYSYGEVAPLVPNSPAALHNQTLTITTFAER